MVIIIYLLINITTSNTFLVRAGFVAGGLMSHPDGLHIIYPMGAKLVVENRKSGKQTLLDGHTSGISAVAVSPCGRFLASGQQLRPPYHKAYII